MALRAFHAVLLVLAARSARAAFLSIEPVVPVAAPVVAAAPVLSPLAAVPLLTAPALAPALAAPSVPLAASPAPAAAPAAARFDFVVRRGRDRFGRSVLIVDALDRADAARGTVGHVDVSFGEGTASLDLPLDEALAAADRTAALSHFREHLWFGLAVVPGYAGSGLGSRLLDEAEARLRAEGVKTLFLRATETSVGFYRRRYGARVLDEDEEDGADGEKYYRLEIGL
jgi:GNAT superfamily N-acetyltransferase